MSSLKVVLQAANPFSSCTPELQLSESSCTPEPPSEAAILHHRFSILSLLLTLITTINSGHPTLSNGVDVVQQKDQSEQHGKLEIRPHIMEAVLAVLVQESEILACMTYGTEPRPTRILAAQQPQQTVRDSQQPTRDDSDELEQYRYEESSPLRVAAIANGLLLKMGGKKSREATKNVPQGKKKAGGLKGGFQGKKLREGTKDQLQGQEARGAKDRLRGQGTQDNQLQDYVLVEPGKSPRAFGPIEEPVRETKDSRVSFPNHAATVSTYLNEYRKEQDPERREKLSARFTRYLILACWRKMKMRASHWAVVGIICHLALAPREALLHMEVQPSTRVDRRLAMNLLALDEIAALDGPVSYYQRSSPIKKASDSIPHLLRACKDSRPLYTRDTAFDFHRLLVGTLLAYASLLERYGTMRSERAQIDQQLALSSSLLRVILFSDAFDCHIRSLVQTSPPILSLPMSDRIDNYVNFARTRHIRCTRPRGSGEEGKEKLGPSMAEESKQPGVELGSTSDIGFDADENEDETPDTTNEVDDILSHTEGQGSKNLCKIVNSSLKLLVKYDTAQGALESYCESLEPGSDHEIDIKLLRVNPREGDMPEWDEIKTVITSVLAKSVKRVDSDDTIKYIDKLVTKLTENGKSAPHTIFHTFDYIIHGVSQPISYNVHCEAALVAFASAADEGIKDPALRTLKTVLDRKDVGVSKLCCPACGELIGLLQRRSNATEYNIYGCHSTIFPVQLPPGLSVDILKEMTMKFEGYLDVELALLQANRKKANNLSSQPRPPSRQSVGSNISNKSLKSMIASKFRGGVFF